MSERWVRWRRAVDLDEYDRRWEEMAARGESVHGEVDFIERRTTGRCVRILDAGCGTGRLAIEAERRGHQAMGADLDPDMIDRARSKAAHIEWVCADLSTLHLDTTFDVIVMAGNIPLFCAPGSQAAIISNLANHLAPEGILICGYSLEKGANAYTVANFCRDAASAGLDHIEQYVNWDGDPIDTSGSDDYVVVVCSKSVRAG